MVMTANKKLARSLMMRLASRRGSYANSRTQRGFTLLELTIVLLIMATTAAVAVPRWTTSLQKLKVSNAASRIAADLARTQSASFNSSSGKTITFNVDSSQYTISDLRALTGGSGPYIVALSADPFRCRLVSVWGQTGTQTITFNGYGIPNKGGKIIVEAGDQRKTVEVDSASGTAVVR